MKPLFFVQILALWYGVWAVYNFFLKERKITNSGQTVIGLFFAASAALSYCLYYQFIPRMAVEFLYILGVLILAIQLLRSLKLKFKLMYKFESKRTMYLTATVFNVFFQQTVVNAVVGYMYLFLPSVSVILIFTVFWGLTHSPLLIMKHVADREMDVAGAFLLGLVSGYLILNFQAGYIFAFLIHYLFYVVYSLRINDESRI